MVGVKRRNDDNATGSEKANKRRAVYSQQDAQLAKIYNDLAEDVEELRLKAAGELIKHVATQLESDSAIIDRTLDRLIKGLCSSRKAARLGFSVALSEVLRLALTRKSSLTLEQVVQKIVQRTTSDKGASGQEKRDGLLGRQFALQAILHTGANILTAASSESWQLLISTIADLAVQRQWLRKQCGAMLYDFLESAKTQIQPYRLQILVDTLSLIPFWKTPEGIALWLALSNVDGITLPKHVWHHRDPFSNKERPIIAKVMQEVTTDDDDQKSGPRQITPSFAWSVVLRELLSRESLEDFDHFWDVAISRGLFNATSSNERKSLGLQIVTLTLKIAPARAFERTLSPETIRCIINHRSNEDRYLFQATKGPLHELTIRALTERNTAAISAIALLRVDIHFDHTTKTKTVETLLDYADAAALNGFILEAEKIMLRPGGQEVSQAESRRRSLADILVSTLRSCRDELKLFVEKSGFRALSPWADGLIRALLTACYKPLSDVSQYDPPISEQARSFFRTRLNSCIGHLLSFPVELACLAPNLILTELHDKKVLQAMNAKSPINLKINRAEKTRKAISNGAVAGLDGSDLTTSHALHLLLSMSMLQVYNHEPDAVSALEDLLTSIESWDQSTESKTMLIEIILSFISKPSALFRKLAEQVFGAFAMSMTSDSLQSMLDILEQKESASGQHELFDQHGDEADDDSEQEMSEGEAVDVEDDSDVEIINGVVTEVDEDSASESGTDSSVDENENDNESDDEEAEFDRKLADALGPAALDEDEDEDGSDMDDEQMMALEPHLATIFKERQKQSSTKKDNKDARENIINFKNRILDLLLLYVKAQYASEHALELIHPLIVLIRTTTSKPTAEKAFAVLKQYFDAYTKHKSAPPVQDQEMLLALLNLIHSAADADAAKMYANACSRSSLFIAKILVALDRTNYKIVASKYAELQAQWYLNQSSKMQSSIFTEWTSWSISTKKQS